MTEYRFDILHPDNSERTDEGFLHKKCGEMVMTATVTLSNRNNELTMAGDGSVERWPVPYCPNCEDEPHPHGTLNDAGEINHPSFIRVQQSPRRG